jgi:uncharacterized membrane protein YhaH (DUF805 family)
MKQLFDFTRVADRGEFWTIQLITAVLQILLLSLIAGSSAVWLILIAMLALTVIQLSTLVARIRDTGNNVLWVLACFIPYIGLVAWIVFGCLETNKNSVL